MWMGFWPPSKLTRVLWPDLAPAPLWPRPEVLPVPEPSPRPTRLRGRREPGAGLRLCRPIRSEPSAILADLDEMRNLGQHAPDLRRVRNLHRVVDAPQPERAQRVPLALVGAVGRPLL